MFFLIAIYFRKISYSSLPISLQRELLICTLYGKSLRLLPTSYKTIMKMPQQNVNSCEMRARLTKKFTSQRTL